MTKIRVAINGFGRIGRIFFRIALAHPEFEFVAVNDLGGIENLAYLLKYDTVYGRAPFDVRAAQDADRAALVVNERGGAEKKVPVFNQKDPALLPWRQLGVDIVVEATGVFDSYEKSKAHLRAGAKRVVITAPVKDEPIGINGATVLMGVNEERLKTCDISSNASCTTNAGSPVLAILHEEIGIEKAIINTAHGYTASQNLVDGPSSGKDLRRGRAAAANIAPSSTGAAEATTRAIAELAGKFDGVALRVPVVNGSIADITCVMKRMTTADEVNGIFRQAAGTERWKRVFSVTDEPLVSSDIIGSPYASIADLAMTRVVGGDLVKVLAWYDNEMGYAYSLIEHVAKSGKYLVDSHL
ncbi:MAG: type I glyceraldehyde-3-phosphate dehydrogenase [Parcubacteria group bacterium]|nr:type I glyceraldehyde-3-phosphate dehydrogenase [Parcubacteria group bacterium]